jgi:hypothetical protein
MAKRLTDTQKWNKPFIRTMKAPYKLLWLYILDECDHAGIWQVDVDVAQIKIGERLSIEAALDSFAGKVHPFDNGTKWFIPDFIEFQYVELNPENKAHKSVINILTKYNLIKNQKHLASPLHAASNAAMDIDKDKDIVIKEPNSKNFKQPTEQEVADYITTYSNEKKLQLHSGAAKYAQKFVLHYQQKGWMIGKNKMKDWQAAVRNWITNGWFADLAATEEQTVKLRF